MNLNQKHILITGASRGIGLALAKGCAKRGCHLYLVSRKLAADLETQLQALGAISVTRMEFDLSEKHQIEKLGADLDLRKIKIDVLINNAGLLTGGLLEKQDIDEIDRMLNVNVHALIRLTHRLLPQMLKRKSGLIVNNASVAGKMFFPCSSTYSASKAAVIAFTESLKQELFGTGVRTLLMITPGVKTEMFDNIPSLYGKNLDMSAVTSVSAESWAEEVVLAMESRQSVVGPSGLAKLGVTLAHNFPSVFEKLVRSRFSRD